VLWTRRWKEISYGFGPRTSGKASAWVAVWVIVATLTGSRAGAQIAVFAGSQRTVAAGLGSNAVAVDGSGNLYLAGFDNGTVVKLAAVNGVIPPSPVVTSVATGFTHPNGLAVDSSGNLYVADAGDLFSGGSVAGSISEIAAAAGTPRVLTGNLKAAVSVAVNAQGDVFFADRDASLVGEILASSGTIGPNPTIRTLGSGFNQPFGIALDTSGNVYVTDGGDGVVKEMIASDGSIPASPTIVTLGSGFVQPTGIAVDTTGNVFVADAGLHGVREIVAVNGTIPANPTIYPLGSGFNLPYGIALDSQEHVFVADLNDAIISLGGVNFGTLAVGSPSAPLKLTFIFNASVTLNATPYRIVTQGALNLDFVPSATQGTDVCSAKSYNSGDMCSVAVTFMPTRPGQRPGAVLLAQNDASGTTISTAFVYGTGTAPIASFGYTAPTVVMGANTNLTQPIGIAVDGSGNVYAANGIRAGSSGALLKETFSGGSYTQSVVPTSTLNGPRDVTVDGAGNVYVVNTLGNPNTVLKESLNTDGTFSESVVVTGGMYYASGIGVDEAGNVYIGNQGPGGPNGYVQKETLHSDGTYTNAIILSSLAEPYGIAVDATGSVYFGETAFPGDDRVLKETPVAGGSYTRTVVATELNLPQGIAVDPEGNVYIADTGANLVLKATLQSDGTYVQSTGTSSGPDKSNGDNSRRKRKYLRERQHAAHSPGRQRDQCEPVVSEYGRRTG
jgi:DNA-binding beta-propeller fold protein YncE